MENHTMSWMELEMLHGLYHLRYMTTEQLLGVWYKSHTPDSGVQRLRRLGAAKVICSTNTLNPHYGVVRSVGPEGLRILRDVKAGRYRGHKLLSLQHIPHQLELNAVFLTLASGEPVWERLPFAWATSRRNALAYQERRRDEFGVLRKRRALLIPDALITPQSSAEPHIFLELDRSTECLREQDGRRSIRRKLRAYSTYLTSGDWYRQAFGDERRARVVFVLQRRDRPTREPAERDRRVRSITAAARELAREVSVKVVYLDDADALRRACCIPSGRCARPRPRPAGPTPRWTRADFVALNTLHQTISHLYPRMPPAMQRRILDDANAAQAVLARVAATLTDASAVDASVHPGGGMHAEMHRMHGRDASDARGASRADASVHPGGGVHAEMQRMHRRDASDARLKCREQPTQTQGERP